jgi:hypothetical protein
MLSVPVAELAIAKEPLFAQTEPAPFTVTVPLEPVMPDAIRYRPTILNGQRAAVDAGPPESKVPC